MIPSEIGRAPLREADATADEDQVGPDQTLLEVLPRHCRRNRFFCNFYSFLDYLIRLNYVGYVGSHTLQSCTEDLQSLLFIQFHG
jgi:hypothetical protein